MIMDITELWASERVGRGDEGVGSVFEMGRQGTFAYAYLPDELENRAAEEKWPV